MNQELLASGFKRMDFNLAEGSYETIADYSKTLAFNGTEYKLDPDLMYVSFILCHEGENANGDYFTKEVLKAAEFTPRFKPVDWEHGQPMIGTMLDSMYKEDASGRGYIEAIGVVWKFIYPELSSSIKQKSATGELKLSMECYYREATYKVGENFYSQAEAEKLGVISYVGRDYMGQHVTRVFKEVIFGGVGVVANPADKEAVFLSVARDLKSHGLNVNINSVEENQIKELAKMVADSITRNVNDFSSRRPNEESSNAVAVARYVKAFDKAKSSIVSKFNNDALRTKDQIVGEVKNVLNTFMTEVSSINNDYFKEVAGEDQRSEAAQKNQFFGEIEGSISSTLFVHYQSFSETLEAYLVGVSEDYFIYELYDYSLAYPDSVKLFKGFYTIADDGQVAVQFEKAVEVERVVTYKELASENSEKEVSIVKDEETKIETVVAEETEVVTPVVAEEKCCEANPECDCSTDYKAKASDLQSQVDDLTTKLEAANTAKASLESRVAELESTLGEIESEKVAQARKTELEGLGIKLSESRQAKLKDMSAEAYEDFKGLLVEVAGSNVAETKVEASKEEAVKTEEVEQVTVVASDEEDEEEVEIIVEGATASAGIVIEQPTVFTVKPFGHLSSK